MVDKEKRMKSLTPDVTTFINDLNQCGVETKIEIYHKHPNTVQFNVVCRNWVKDAELVSKILFSMFGI